MKLGLKQLLNNTLSGKKAKETIHDICGKCPTCQRTKKSTIKYGHLLAKTAEVHPWEKFV